LPVPVLLSTVFTTLALVFYSIGVCSERIAGRLKVWHPILFSGWAWSATLWAPPR